MTITRSTISGNSAATGGGGISNWTTLTVTDSTFNGNSSGFGGGIANYGGTLTVISSTLSGNHANGGGIGQYGGQITVRNTILAGNTGGPYRDVSATLNSQGHNLIGDGTGGSGYDRTDLVGTADNPIDPQLDPLADNGGPTQTMALLPGSPAIDAGDNTNAPEWDQRGPGFPRIVNGIIDIGAFEVQQTVAPTVTCSVAQSLLWPPNHRLVNVGLGVTVDPPDANLDILVYANDHASPADAADIAPGTLQLRSERQGNGNGRVYLVVVTATNSDGASSFDVCAVAVPHDHSPGSIASVQQQAADAAAFYQEFQTAPPGYHLLGEGPDGGSGAPSSGPSGRNAIPGDIFRPDPPGSVTPLAARNQAPFLSGADETSAPHFHSTWASLPVDGYFATAHEEGLRLTTPHWQQAAWEEGNSPTLDLVLNDDQLVG